MASLKKNLRLFNGFPFDAASGQFSKKREKLLKYAFPLRLQRYGGGQDDVLNLFVCAGTPTSPTES